MESSEKAIKKVRSGKAGLFFMIKLEKLFLGARVVACVQAVYDFLSDVQ